MKNTVTLYEVVFRFLVRTQGTSKVLFISNLENELKVPGREWQYHVLPFWNSDEVLVEIMFSYHPTQEALTCARESVEKALEQASKDSEIIREG